MLPHRSRLTDRRSITHTVRRGTSCRRGHLTVHVLNSTDSDQPPTVAFAVSKSVGNSVMRHRTARRLRHVMQTRINRLPLGTTVVVRAQEGAHTDSSAQLAADLDDAFAVINRRIEQQ